MMLKTCVFWFVEMVLMFILATIRPDMLTWDTFNAGVAFGVMAWWPALLFWAAFKLEDGEG